MYLSIDFEKNWLEWLKKNSAWMLAVCLMIFMLQAFQFNLLTLVVRWQLESRFEHSKIRILDRRTAFFFRTINSMMNLAYLDYLLATCEVKTNIDSISFNKKRVPCINNASLLSFCLLVHLFNWIKLIFFENFWNLSFEANLLLFSKEKHLNVIYYSAFESNFFHKNEWGRPFSFFHFFFILETFFPTRRFSQNSPSNTATLTWATLIVVSTVTVC